jgi:hypothetical protein
MNILNYSQGLSNFGVSLHSRIVNLLLVEIENAVIDGRIRSQSGKHSIFDFIKEILGKKTEREVWKRFTADFPVVVTFCDFIPFVQKSGRTGRPAPATNTTGLLYIAYFADCDYSHKLRSASASYFAADPMSSTPQIAAPAYTAPTFTYPVAQLKAIANYCTLAYTKAAIRRDYVEGLHYVVV